MQKDEPTISSRTAGPQRYRFGSFVLDQARGSLSENGTEIFLRPKSFSVLSYLLENAGRIVKRSELLDAVWPDVVVTDDSISQCLIDIRQAIDDTDRNMIRTIPRKGLILDVPVEICAPGLKTKPGPSRHWVRYKWFWGAALAISAMLALAWYIFNSSASRDKLDGQKSIAVLKFTDMSPPPGHAYLAEGFSEEIIHMLTQGTSLTVIARTSSFALTGEPIDVIAEKLGVNYVLEGSIRQHDSQLRVTAQLIDVEKSAHLWSRSFERDLDNLIEVQKEIANALARQFDVSPVDLQPFNPDRQAYERFLEARYIFNRRGENDLELAQQKLEDALRIDPQFARAWAELAHVIFNRLYHPITTVTESDQRTELEEQQRHAIIQALKYGPDLPEAHHQAALKYYFDGNWDKAAEHLEFNRNNYPDHPVVLVALAHEERNSGHIEDARKLTERLLTHDPLNIAWRASLIQDSLWSGYPQDVFGLVESVRELNSANSHAVLHFGTLAVRALILTGDFTLAESELEEMPEGPERAQAEAMITHALGQHSRSEDAFGRLLAYGDSQENLLRIAEVHAYRLQIDQALDRLRGIEIRPDCSNDHFLQSIYYSPFLAPLDEARNWVSIRQTAFQMMRGCRIGFG